MKVVPLGELMPSRIPSVNPGTFPDEQFTLWSIPSYDAGKPEQVHGRDVGSSKKIVQDGDVLLSKIVPHIRRAWKVSVPNEHRQIASSEWITFRHNAFLSDYIRHFLLTDQFHRQFMGTVAGVGGSLLRAQPKSVAKIGIPLPPLKEQWRIVGLLDRAAEIRRRADAARSKARAIIPALFLDMFGDPATNPKGWPIRPLGETAAFFGGATLPEGIPFTGQKDGYLLCKVSTLALPENSNGIVSSVEWSERHSARSAVAPPGSILFPKRGAAIATNRKRLLIRTGALDPNLMGVRGRPEYYAPGFLLSLFEAFDLISIASGSTVPQLNKQDLQPLEKIVPPLALQASFAEQAQRIEATARALDTAAAKAEAMAAALSAEVFG